MKIAIETKQVESLPKQEIILTLSPAEFAMLDWLRWKHLGGHASVRSSIEHGFARVVDELHPGWRDLVQQARNVSDRKGSSGWASVQIDDLFLAHS